MDVKEAQEKARELRTSKEDAEKALKQAQREAKADEAPAKWVWQAASGNCRWTA